VQPRARSRRSGEPADRAGRTFHLRPSRRAGNLDHRAFLGHDRSRPLCRKMPRSCRAACFLRTGHVAPEEGRASDLCRLASRLTEGPMGSVHRGSTIGRAGGSLEAPLRGVGISVLGHGPGEPNALADECQDAERAVAGYRCRRRGRSRLRSWPHPRACRDHSRRMGQPRHRRRCPLALRCAESLARETRCEDRTRHPSHAPRRESLRALSRGADLSRRTRPPSRRIANQRCH